MNAFPPSPASWPFAKGHGCENSFLLLPDPDNHLVLRPADVRRLTDLHTGAGADGILRAVRTAADPEAAGMAGEAEWFMDYRNADGSLGAMCGNGIRVFARYLIEAGLTTTGVFTVATRAGLRRVHTDRTGGPISVDMGRPRFPGPDRLTIYADGHRWAATHVDIGNPHAVTFVQHPTDAGALHAAPTAHPANAFPEGFTTEFVTVLGPHHLALRVHERGVGETRACGTGACAAVAAYRLRTRQMRPADYRVDLPGGQLGVTVHASGRITLTGPAHITAHGTLNGLPTPRPASDLKDDRPGRPQAALVPRVGAPLHSLPDSPDRAAPHCLDCVFRFPQSLEA
ncbi:diaminopimelate epimerase [Streptomyces melanogenes]|uniref:diaminopimelate epimerase n=1 Tax=Streptomyces melanogenes TaxID=67326 RepID=UPI00167F0DAB|nr:diaminopimelate epimerase [Streptomyces melanogenes]GGP79973.1 diaminopimelate epimerase [Streptomyces melanogenes]